MRRTFCFSRKLQSVADQFGFAVFTVLSGNEVARSMAHLSE